MIIFFENDKMVIDITLYVLKSISNMLNSFKEVYLQHCESSFHHIIVIGPPH